jgi:hypothetical protein
MRVQTDAALYSNQNRSLGPNNTDERTEFGSSDLRNAFVMRIRLIRAGLKSTCLAVSRSMSKMPVGAINHGHFSTI